MDRSLDAVSAQIAWAFPAGSMSSGALERRSAAWQRGRDCAYSDCDAVAMRLRDALAVLNAGVGGLHLDPAVSPEYETHAEDLAAYIGCLAAAVSDADKDYVAPVLAALRADREALRDWADLELNLGELE